ncbi:ceramide synthase 6 [Meleagris gallopavo]|uniref:ceramide synthase 6 n=1 Tax=Meleagris gallopavo TaxID=9103 RepID=UPI00093B4A2D|nr:ceramide synthase 6 [Meleagris gallopavo]
MMLQRISKHCAETQANHSNCIPLRRLRHQPVTEVARFPLPPQRRLSWPEGSARDTTGSVPAVLLPPRFCGSSRAAPRAELLAAAAPAAFKPRAPSRLSNGCALTAPPRNKRANREVHRILGKTPWLWNTRQCWTGYPYQPLMPDLHYYYIAELSFYWSLMFSQFIDIKRKDFGIMFTHHIVTVTLITFSYVTNLTRVGTLTLCLHDAADVVLEAAKMANYCKCQKLSDLLFLTFAIVFIVSRLGIYPLWILNTTLFELYEALGNFPALWVFNVLLLVLQILHCFWSYLIIKAAYKAISKGKVTKDDRSDIESSSDEEETVPRSKTLHSTITTNGTGGANGTNGYLTGSTCSEEH